MERAILIIKWQGLVFSLRLLHPVYENSRNGWRIYSQVPETTASDKDLPTNFYQSEHLQEGLASDNYFFEFF